MENVEVQSFNLIKHTNDLPQRRTMSLQRNIEREGRRKGAKNRSRTRGKQTLLPAHTTEYTATPALPADPVVRVRHLGSGAAAL